MEYPYLFAVYIDAVDVKITWRCGDAVDDVHQLSLDKLKGEIHKFLAERGSSRAALITAQNAMSEISHKGHKTGYDWNADPAGLTRLEGDAFAAIDKALMGS